MTLSGQWFDTFLNFINLLEIMPMEEPWKYYSYMTHSLILNNKLMKCFGMAEITSLNKY